MRRGIGTYALSWSIGIPGHMPENPMDAFSFLEFARQHDAEVVQFADNLPLHTLSPEERTRLRDTAEAAGIAVEVGIRGIQPEKVRDYIGIAEFFGSPIIRAVIDEGSFRPEISEIVHILKMLSDELERAGVILALENHDRFTAEQFSRIIRETASPHIGVCLDTVNSFGALEGPEVVTQTLIDFVVCLHLKDFTIRRPSHNMGFLVEGAILGEGRLDISGTIKALKERNRECSIILEQWPPPEDSPEKSVQKEQEWAEKSMKTLMEIQLI